MDGSNLGEGLREGVGFIECEDLFTGGFGGL